MGLEAISTPFLESIMAEEIVKSANIEMAAREKDYIYYAFDVLVSTLR